MKRFRLLLEFTASGSLETGSAIITDCFGSGGGEASVCVVVANFDQDLVVTGDAETKAAADEEFGLDAPLLLLSLLFRPKSAAFGTRDEDLCCCCCAAKLSRIKLAGVLYMYW